MCNNFIVEGIYKKDPLINPSVTANASHVRHNDFQRPNRIFTSQIFDDLKLLPLPVTNSFCEPLPFTRYPFLAVLHLPPALPSEAAIGPSRPMFCSYAALHIDYHIDPDVMQGQLLTARHTPSSNAQTYLN